MSLHSITSYIINKIPESPQYALILGSGLGNFVNSIKKRIIIPYDNIPEFPKSTVPGHAGEWVFGYVNEKPIICASGRFHYYEGFTMEEIVLPVSVIHSLGCELLIITNASGCLKKEWEIGDLMLITGYLDYTFRENTDLCKIVSFEKDIDKLNKIREIASNIGLLLREGIYTWTLGPSYETQAEIRDIISLGGNAVGMSTIPEIMKASALDLKLIGISCLTNYGAGMEQSELTHEEVLKISKQADGIFSRFLIEIINYSTFL